MKTKLHRLTDREHATVLAALRFYQYEGLDDNPDLRPADIDDIATNGAALDPLAGTEIDALCERLNTTSVAAPAARQESIADALRLAIARAERELHQWPERETGSIAHRALRMALGKYQHAFDSLMGGAS